MKFQGNKENMKLDKYPPDYKGPKAGLSDKEEWLQATEFQAFKYARFKDWSYADFDCWLSARDNWYYNKGGEDRLKASKEANNIK